MLFDEGLEDEDWMEVADWMLEYVKREVETLVKG
jgi:polyphosphate kinase